MAMSEDQEAAITAAKVTASEYEHFKEKYEQAGADRITAINTLRDHDVSWAEIGRIFGTSPQAAMYVSGHAKRTPPKGTRKKRPAKKA